TANLDVEAEAEVMHALNVLIVGRTVLTISHRLSTLGQVDEILVMQRGKIVERGSFMELKRMHGVFAGLLEEQNRYNLDRDDKDKSVVRSAFADTSPFVPALLSATQPYIPAVSRSSVTSPIAIGSHSAAPVATSTTQSDTLEVLQNGHEKIAAAKNALMHRQGISPIQARVFLQVDGKNIGAYRLHKTML